MKRYILMLGALLSLGMISCSEDWMGDVIPTDKLEDDQAFNTVKDGRNAVNGVLSLMQDEEYYGANYIVYGDLKAIDVRSSVINKRDDNMYRYTETTEAGNSGMWTQPYKCLVSVNNAIANLDKMVPDGDAEKVQKTEIEANFYALRGLIHFDLLKIYSRIPTSVANPASELGVVHADHVITKDEQPDRKNLAEGYAFVISDLKKAIELMPAAANTEGWFNKTAVKALLARVYLFNGDNQLAYDMAKEVIGDANFSLVPYGDYKSSWTNTYNNKEALFTLINTDDDNPSREGIGYLWSKTGYSTMMITMSFKDLLYANANDDRIKAIEEDVQKDKDGNVTGTDYLCLKYPDEFANKLHLIRLSEMYFIAAEAIYKVGAGNAAEAATLINTVIKERTDEENVLVAGDINIDRIISEKRKEFIGEGHTFFDLMRNKKDVVRTGDDHLVVAPKTIKYDDFKTIQPIPRLELNVNNNIQQNPGYAD
jgi:CTP:phosphocholine cytidylyltransferase-like protein